MQQLKVSLRHSKPGNIKALKLELSVLELKGMELKVLSNVNLIIGNSKTKIWAIYFHICDPTRELYEVTIARGVLFSKFISWHILPLYPFKY